MARSCPFSAVIALTPRDAARAFDEQLVTLIATRSRYRRPAQELTVLVPTRNEVGNVAPLVARVAAAVRGFDAEVLFVDDSDDDTPGAVLAVGAGAALPVRLLHRGPERRCGGLGGAVKAGLAATGARWVVVMDGDLQHPPETIPQLVMTALTQNLDVVVASRYRVGGAANGLSSLLREWCSSSATGAARALFPQLLRRVTDPMSGFFALRREAVDPATLRPRGFKVLLEILARSAVERVDEVGFTFAEREHGRSKASSREALRYLHQLVALRLATSPRPAATLPRAPWSAAVASWSMWWLRTTRRRSLVVGRRSLSVGS